MAFDLELVTPEKTALSGRVTFVLVRSLDGDVGILTGHAPMLVGLDIGRLEAHLESGDIVLAAVHGGFMEVAPKHVSVLADVTELASEIDVERAERARDRATIELESDDSGDVREQLRRAEVRLETAALVSG